MKHALSVCCLAGMIALGVATIPSAALAQGTCSPFTLTSSGEERSVEFVDVGREGVSNGDLRIGVRSLTTGDGTPAGQARWKLTVMEPRRDGSGASYIEWVFALSDGLIFTNGLMSITSAPDDTTTQTFEQPEQFAIVGGTGAYAGARGTQTKTKEGLRETYNLDITCQ